MSAVNRFFSEDYELGGILREYEVVINENGGRPFRAIKPTDVVRIEGKDYKLTPMGSSPKDVDDVIANLVRRVNELEAAVGEILIDADNRDMVIESLESDIVMLDERTQPLNALAKAVKKEDCSCR